MFKDLSTRQRMRVQEANIAIHNLITNLYVYQEYIEAFIEGTIQEKRGWEEVDEANHQFEREARYWLESSHDAVHFISLDMLEDEENNGKVGTDCHDCDGDCPHDDACSSDVVDEQGVATDRHCHCSANGKCGSQNSGEGVTRGTADSGPFII